MQSQSGLSSQLAGQRNRKRTEPAHQLADWQALQILHHQIRPILIDTRIVGANHMLVLQQADRPHLPLEPLHDARGIQRLMIQRAFDRPQLVEHRMTRQEHDAESPSVQFPKDVVAEKLPSRTGRGGDHRRLARDDRSIRVDVRPATTRCDGRSATLRRPRGNTRRAAGCGSRTRRCTGNWDRSSLGWQSRRWRRTGAGMSRAPRWRRRWRTVNRPVFWRLHRPVSSLTRPSAGRQHPSAGYRNGPRARATVARPDRATPPSPLPATGAPCSACPRSPTCAPKQRPL